jgi:hypothetical protein
MTYMRHDYARRSAATWGPMPPMRPVAPVTKMGGTEAVIAVRDRDRPAAEPVPWHEQ